jgi:hypothetical protein
MTSSRPNPANLDRQHPVRAMLLEAALGRKPTKAQLRTALDRDDVPDGVNLNRFAADVAGACSKVAQTYAPTPNQTNHGEARKLADEYAADLGVRMTDDEAAVRGMGGESESSDAIASRMFRIGN